MRSAFKAAVLAICLTVGVCSTPSSAIADDTANPVPVIRWDASGYTGPVGAPVLMTGTYENLPADSALIVETLNDGVHEPTDVVVQAADGAFQIKPLAAESPTAMRVVIVAGGEVVAFTDDVELRGVPGPSSLTLSIPHSAKDLSTVKAAVRWSARYGPRPSGTVLLQFRHRGKTKWGSSRKVTVTSGRGRAKFTPRYDGRYRLLFKGSKQLAAKISASSSFDNRPTGRVITLPKGSRKPTLRVPKQPRADRVRADAKISKISDRVWKEMKGRTWHRGCPVGRKSLRIIRVNYWSFDGFIRRGEIVMNKSAATSTAKIFTDLFGKRTPIRSLYRVDRFGYRKSLRGGDDLRSMRADNSSGFNCRRVVGATYLVSPHSYGRSIDLNTWENPYRSRSGYEPNSSWARRSQPSSITWRGTKDPVVKIFRKHGFRWLGAGDLQHFQR